MNKWRKKPPPQVPTQRAPIQAMLPWRLELEASWIPLKIPMAIIWDSFRSLRSKKRRTSKFEKSSHRLVLFKPFSLYKIVKLGCLNNYSLCPTKNL